MGTQENYSPYQDKRLFNVAKELSMYLFVILFSGYCTKRLIEYMVDPEASKVYDDKF